GVCPSTVGLGPAGGGGAGSATDCNLLITFNADGSIKTETGPQTNYDSIEDALIGVANHSGHAISLFNIDGGALDIFGFDRDGIDAYLGIGANGKDGSNGGYGGPNAFFNNIIGNKGTVNF